MPDEPLNAKASAWWEAIESQIAISQAKQVEKSIAQPGQPDYPLASEPDGPPIPKYKSVKWASIQPPQAPPHPQTLMSLPPLTKEEWNRLDGKGKWDSVVALRGPDLVRSDTVKWFTTAVIRHRLSGAMRVGGLVNSVLPFVVLPKDLVSRKIASFDAGHFVQHVMDACHYVCIPMAFMDSTLWIKHVLGGMNALQESTIVAANIEEPYRSNLIWSCWCSWHMNIIKQDQATSQTVNQTVNPEEASDAAGEF